MAAQYPVANVKNRALWQLGACLAPLIHSQGRFSAAQAIARDAIFANGDQQSHAIDFCVARLVDRASLEPALRGCLMFLKAESPSAAPRATPAQLLDLAKNLTENVFPQQLPQATRSQAMHCLASLIEVGWCGWVGMWTVGSFVLTGVLLGWCKELGMPAKVPGLHNF